jgi:GntR family transcriptional regulator, transcriptional repressor for pyruvate dehydrogenase complex
VFKPVERSTLSQSVADQLIQFIKDGQLTPGQQLPSERELAERLQVGRSTLREALRSLTMLNIIEQRPGQGTFVLDITAATVVRADLLSAALSRSLTGDLLEARLLIEPFAAEMAAERADGEDFGAIQAALDACRANHMASQPTAALSVRFHEAIAQAAHNAVLEMFMRSLHSLLEERGAHLERLPEYCTWELASHQEIADALRARDKALAHRRMVAHLDESARRLLAAG